MYKNAGRVFLDHFLRSWASFLGRLWKQMVPTPKTKPAATGRVYFLMMCDAGGARVGCMHRTRAATRTRARGMPRIAYAMRITNEYMYCHVHTSCSKATNARPRRTGGKRAYKRPSFKTLVYQLVYGKLGVENNWINQIR